MKHPERITAIISQNGNAYEEGLSEGWNPIRAYWENASPVDCFAEVPIRLTHFAV